MGESTQATYPAGKHPMPAIPSGLLQSLFLMQPLPPSARCKAAILLSWGFCRYAVGELDKATGKMQVMDAEAGRIIRMEPRCPGVEYEDTGAGVRSEPLDAETRMKEYKR